MFITAQRLSMTAFIEDGFYWKAIFITGLLLSKRVLLNVY